MKSKKLFIIFIIAFIFIILYGCTSQQNPQEYIIQDINDSDTIPVSPEISEGEMQVTLYFADDSFTYLIPETRVINKDDNVIEQIAMQLLEGPYQPESKKLFVEQVEILSVAEIDRTAFVNFNYEFIDMLSGKFEEQQQQEQQLSKQLIKRKNELAVYSIVNTLTEVEGIQRVHFLVEGNIIKDSPSNMDLENKLSRDKKYILDPQKLVEQYFKEIAAKNWEKAYKYLYIPDEQNSITYEQFVVNASKKDASLVEYQVKDFEILSSGNIALVTVDYQINFNDNTSIARSDELITVIKQNEIWKVDWYFPPEY